jgi:hypothetical protein
MAFVNEYVPEEDIKKYGFEEINLCYGKSDVRPDWTVDRENDVYLRWIVTGENEFRNQHDFVFYWKGTLIFVRLRISDGRVLGTRAWAHWKLVTLNLPEELQEKKPDILTDLKAALTVYKDFGIYSTLTEHTATFEF